jgi:hypothetical protein
MARTRTASAGKRIGISSIESGNVALKDSIRWTQWSEKGMVDRAEGPEERGGGKRMLDGDCFWAKIGQKGWILRQKEAISRGLCLLISTWGALNNSFIFLYLIEISGWKKGQKTVGGVGGYGFWSRIQAGPTPDKLRRGHGGGAIWQRLGIRLLCAGGWY